MAKKILVCYPMPRAGIAILNQQFTQQQVDIYTDLAPENLKDIISDYNAVIMQSNLWINEGILKAATKLEIIALAQVGLEKIDIQGAKDRNIKIVNSKANVPSTAEFTMALMLDIARGITATSKLIQSGRFEDLERFKKLKQIPGRQVTGATLGIIGLGDIGIEVAKKAARGFNMKLIPYNRESENARSNAKELDCKLCTDLQYLLENSDFVTIHLPKKKTDNFINKENLQQMKKTAFLINTSRGGIINEAALLEALKNDIIAGAALDVFEFEENPNLPPQISEDLINFAESNPNKLLLSPHRGARTEEAQENAAIEVANQVCNFLCPH